MSAPAIPPAYLALIGCLRGAVNVQPPPADLAAADWATVFRQAREQGVDTYLYPWLAARLPDAFSLRAPAPADAAQAAWRATFLSAVPHSSARRRQVAEILAACAEAHLELVPLKGAWLSEAVYDDPAQRSMSDLDLLARAEDCTACHALLLKLGYQTGAPGTLNAFACDRAYRHPDRPMLVELHWNFESEKATGAPAPDIDDIWRHTRPARFLGSPVRLLPPADQIAHLTQHILHHLFAMPLRGYLDIALLLKAFGADLTPAALDEAAARWKTGRAIPFVLRLVSDLFALPLPPALQADAPGADTARLGQACDVIFDLPTVRSRDGETTLLRFKRATPLGRLTLVLRRIFMPRDFLVLHYPCARHLYGLPLAWLRRACDLRRNNRAKLRALLASDRQAASALANAERRIDLVNWLRSPPAP